MKGSVTAILLLALPLVIGAQTSAREPKSPLAHESPCVIAKPTGTAGYDHQQPRCSRSRGAKTDFAASPNSRVRLLLKYGDETWEY